MLTIIITTPIIPHQKDSHLLDILLLLDELLIFMFYISSKNKILSFFLRISVIFRTFAAMFEKEISEYESIRQDYQEKIADRMGHEQWMEYNEILFSAHSCAIEGNSFTVDDTRILRECSEASFSSAPSAFYFQRALCRR